MKTVQVLVNGAPVCEFNPQNVTGSIYKMNDGTVIEVRLDYDHKPSKNKMAVYEPKATNASKSVAFKLASV